MADAEDPAQHALDAHAEARVRHGPEAPEVQVPAEVLEPEPVGLDPTLEESVVRGPLPARDDLAEAPVHEAVAREGQLRPQGIRLDVERAAGDGVLVDEEGPIEAQGEGLLVLDAESAPPG